MDRRKNELQRRSRTRRGACLAAGVALLLGAVWPDDPCVVAALRDGPSFDPIETTVPDDADWALWWRRNRPWLAPSAEASTPTRAFSTVGRSARAALLRTRSRLPGPEGDRALLQLGRFGGATAHLDLLDSVSQPGRRGLAAVLALGACRDGAVRGPLKSLFRDEPGGRVLAGSLDREVPIALRAAAACALGLLGHPGAYDTLRSALDRRTVPTGVREAALIGLSFSGIPCDGERFVSVLRDADGPRSVREAAAAAVGRHGTRIPGSTKLLLDALQRDPRGAGRGAAVAFWFAGCGDDPKVPAVLRDVAVHGADPVTRALATLTLAARGHPGSDEACSRLLEHPEGKGFALLAMGLAARARPDSRARLSQVAERQRRIVPHAAAAARRLMAVPGPARPERRREPARIGGANALFLDTEVLQGLLDLVGSLEP